MKLIEIIFWWLNLCAVVLTVISYWKVYQKHKSEQAKATTVKEAVELVGYSCMTFWWAAGTIMIWIFEVNPFWILAWICAGSIIGVFVYHLCEVFGLSMFLQAGEMYVYQMTVRMADEFDKDFDNKKKI